ncbi:MAG: DUF3737 family protein [Muribaculaceae bacterium]|nr:DUF3737 family protein [Muribaculaceae bacterium]
MDTIKNAEFEGERPLFARHDLLLENVSIGVGESALKRCKNIIAEKCTFNGKYPFWHCDGFTVRQCIFNEGARAALWYSRGCKMIDCTVTAPKMFREIEDVEVKNTDFPDGQEMFWHCRHVKLNKVSIHNCDYLFMHSSDITIEDYEQHGNYSFQYARNVEIRNALIHSKDAFWNTENVTVRDSELHGEYLGWHSHNLTLINCHITGTQPLCYAHNLKIIDCTFGQDADLAFEESELDAKIVSPMVSIKNPTTGQIRVPKVGQIILDENIQQPADCKIILE